MDKIGPPAKKKRRLIQHYRSEYAVRYPVITKSSVSTSHAFCNLCKVNINIGHGGLTDVTKHVGTAKHATQAALQTNIRKVPEFFTGNKDLSVIRAEVLFSEFLVEHNLPLACADHAGPLFRKLFPDSAIAKKYGSGRTKTSCIGDTLAKSDARDLVALMQKGAFSIATDGSNDIGAIKLYPGAVRVFDGHSGRVLSLILSVKECEKASTGANIFDILDAELAHSDIPWANCLSFSTDNASVMVGKLNGVAAHIHKKNKNVYIMGCPCHLMHLAALKACKVLPISVDELLIDIFYYLDKSSKRLQSVKHFQNLCGTETRKILKHISTRWLSLGLCVGRLLQQWEPLVAYFATEQKPELKSNSSKSSALKSSSSSVKSNVKSVHFDLKTSSSTTKSNSDPKSPSVKSNVKSIHWALKSSSSTTKSNSDPTSSSVKSNILSSNSALSSSDQVDTTSSPVIRTSDQHQTPTESDQQDSVVETAKPTTSFDISAYIFKQDSLAKKQQLIKQNLAKELERTKKQSVATTHKLMSRVERVNVILQDINTKLYCLFLKNALALFDNANVYLQKGEPVIHKLHSVLCAQLRDLLIRFVKPRVITSCPQVQEIEFTVESNQLPDEDLFVGNDTSEYINTCSTELALTQFYSSVRTFYEVACKYMIMKFPYNDTLLMHASVADIEERSNKSFSSVKYFVQRFPVLTNGDTSTEKLDLLQTQFLQYQVDVLPDAVLSAERIDTAWHQLSLIKDVATGLPKYGALSSVVLGILTIYHSNADCERLFSAVRKNKTDFRSSLSTDTLSSILTHKTMTSARSQVCHTMTHSDELLRQAKSATYFPLSQ